MVKSCVYPALELRVRIKMQIYKKIAYGPIVSNKQSIDIKQNLFTLDQR